MLQAFLRRLKQRHVIRTTGVYAATGYAVFQVANALLPALNLPRWIVTLIATLFLMGFPVVILLAYAFEWTENGLKRTQNDTEPGPKTRLGWFDWALLGGTVAVLAFAVMNLVLDARDRVPEKAEEAVPLHDRSIAVLPFVNFSDFADADYFADGLTEEVINGLAQVADLKVAGRTSSFYFKGRNEDLREIGRQLGVAHVLEGSVRRSGENLRITAQLIQVSDGFHLWSQTFDQTMSDAFVAQTRIARAVAETLQARLVGTPGSTNVTPRDPRAYQLELVARSRLRKQERSELEQSRRLYQELMTLEPDNAAAHVGFAEATLLLAQNFLALDFDQARRESEAAIDKALELDPQSSEAWRVHGYVHRTQAIRSSDRTSMGIALSSLQKAVEINPRNADALALLATQLLTGGQIEQSIALLRSALEIDPLSRQTQRMLGAALESQGKSGEARRQYESLISLYPDFTNAKVSLGQLLISEGKLDEAALVLDEPALIDADPLAGLYLANIYANLGMDPEMRATLGSIREPPAAVALAKAVLYLRTGDRAALQQLVAAQYKETGDPLWLPTQLLQAVLANDAPGAAAALKAFVPGDIFDGQIVDNYAPLDAVFIAYALRLGGREAESRSIFEALVRRLEASPAEYVSNYELWLRAIAYSGLGQVDAALRELTRATDQGFRTLIDVDNFIRLEDYPFMKEVAKDPRYAVLVNRIEADNRRMRDLAIERRR